MSSLSEPDDERYGRFPSVLSVKTPLGMREQLRAVAAVEKISVGEFVRGTLGEALGVTILSDSTQCGPRPTWIMLMQSNASRWSTGHGDDLPTSRSSGGSTLPSFSRRTHDRIDWRNEPSGSLGCQVISCNVLAK